MNATAPIRTIACLVLFAQLLACALAQAAEVIVVPEKIAFGDDLMVRDNVRDECQLEEKIAKFIVTYGKKQKGYDIVSEKPADGNYHVLTARIVNVQGAGGGAWSGAKSVKVKGELTNAAGEVVG